MVQHQLLMYPAAVLFLLGLPEWLVRPVTSARSLQGLLRLLTRPLTCGLLYVVVYSAWHAPAFTTGRCRTGWCTSSHLMFFGVALLYWWPLSAPRASFRPSAMPGLATSCSWPSA